MHGSHTNYDRNMKWLDGNSSRGELLKRIGTALFYINDSDMSNDSLHVFALLHVQSLATRITSFHLEKNKDETDDVETLELIKLINASLIALIARGKVKLAADIIRFAGTLKSLSDGKLDDGKNKKLSIPLERIRILLALFSFLGDGQIPTKKALKIRYKEGIDDGRFSRLLKGMQIRDALPDNPTHSDGGKDAKVWDVRPYAHHVEGSMDEGAAQRITACNDGSRFTTTHTIHARQSKEYKGEGFDLKMRNIRKRLGQAYWLLLIQLGMPDIKQQSDLDLFSKGLSELGLKLIQ